MTDFSGAAMQAAETADRLAAKNEEIERLYTWRQNVTAAANAILAPLTANVGRILEDAPECDVTIWVGTYATTLKAKHFMALYNATDAESSPTLSPTHPASL